MIFNKRAFNWAADFKDPKTCEEILEQVGKTETQYHLTFASLFIVSMVGVCILISARANNTQVLLLGLYMMLVSFIGIVGIIVWTQLRLVMYYLIWDSQKRIEAELRRSRADDL